MKRLVDVSHHQKPENIDYDVLLNQYKEGKIDGVIIRSSYGTGSTGWQGKPDPHFETHYREVTSRGVPAGTYHYIVEYRSVNDQLAIVKQAIDGKIFKLGIWADVELENGAPALTRPTVIEYITKIEAYLGYEVGIYTGNWCWVPIMGYDNPYSSRRLWVGSYTPEPYMPPGWNEWFIWQYTSSGHLDGYAGNLDLNRITDDNWEVLVGEPVIDEIEPINLKLFSQKDTRWANDKLGTSLVTIGSYGCLVTATAMIANYFGKNTDPGQLNKDLIAVNGYEAGNLLKYNSITTIYPDIQVNWNYFLANPDDALIDEVLMQELPVIIQVDYNPETSVLDQHWVIITGKDQHGYIIADPINGEVAYLSKYAGKVFRMVVFEWAQTEEPIFKVKILANALNVRSTPVYIPDGSNIVDLLVKGNVENVYEVNESNGWLRIGINKWISGSTQYVEKIEIEEPSEPALTIEERLDAIEKRLDIIEEEIK